MNERSWFEARDEQDARYAAMGMPRIYPHAARGLPLPTRATGMTMADWCWFVGEPYQGVRAIFNGDLQRANEFEDRAEFRAVWNDHRERWELQRIEEAA